MSGLYVPFTSVREPANECVSIGLALSEWLCRSTHRSPRGLFSMGMPARACSWFLDTGATCQHL